MQAHSSVSTKWTKGSSGSPAAQALTTPWSLVKYISPAIDMNIYVAPLPVLYFLCPLVIKLVTVALIKGFHTGASQLQPHRCWMCSRLQQSERREPPAAWVYCHDVSRPVWTAGALKQLIASRRVTTCFAVGSLSESSSHVSARRKTEQPPSRPSGGAEGDSPLGWDAEGAAGGPSGPLHAPAPRNNDTQPRCAVDR